MLDAHRRAQLDAIAAKIRQHKRAERARRNWHKAPPKPYDGPMTPKERRSFLIYYARVMLREASARTGGFSFFLLEAAGDARREAAAIDLQPKQGDLFG